MGTIVKTDMAWRVNLVINMAINFKLRFFVTFETIFEKFEYCWHIIVEKQVSTATHASHS